MKVNEYFNGIKEEEVKNRRKRKEGNERIKCH